MAHNNLGIVLFQEGRLEEAIEVYNHVLQLNPDDAHAHANLGAALAEKNHLTQAIECYQRAIKLNSNFALWIFDLGVLYAEVKDTETALKYLYKSLEMDPDLPSTNHSIGLIYYELQKYDDAIAAFDRAGSERAFSQLLLCLHAQGKHDKFKQRVEGNLDKYKKNIEVAAVCSFTYDQINEVNIHPFCENPLDFIYSNSLSDYKKNTQKFIDDLLEELKKEPEVWALRKKSAQKGFHTTGNLFSNSCGEILGLEKIIKKEIELYYNKFKSNSCVFMDVWPENLSLYGWSTRLVKDGYNTPHIHPSGWLSGVIYLQLVESENRDEGAIEFSLLGPDYVVINENIPKVRYYPKPGDIVLFPSSLYHYTIPIRNEGERIIVSFDLLPA